MGETDPRSYKQTWGLMIPYLIWIMFDPAPEKGGRPQEWARRLFIWKYFARKCSIITFTITVKYEELMSEYYPCSIVKVRQTTCSLLIETDSRKQIYLVTGRTCLGTIHTGSSACESTNHHNGPMLTHRGAFATFATEGTGFSEHFPGISPHLLTLGTIRLAASLTPDSNFKMPFYREIMMAHGVSSVSKRSCSKILSKGPGTAITIVIGGAAESLSAHPGTADLTLKKRFGFIKMAIRAGADLVPVFSFGENDVS